MGADLEPGTLLAAYRAGMFPMGLSAADLAASGLANALGDSGEPPMAWWSPHPRGVLPLDALVVSRSLRRSVRRYEIRIDTAFDEVVAGCADPDRDGAWITPAIARAYSELHRLGWAHSVEAWNGDQLAGGLYGIAIGGLFAGESMFSREVDASKVALVALVEMLATDRVADRLLDVQWCTPHLESLGCREISRRAYLRALRRALEQPLPEAFAG